MAALPAAKRIRLTCKTPSDVPDMRQDVGREEAGAVQRVYLVTISRVFRQTESLAAYKDLELVDKEDLVATVRDAIDSPVPPVAAGRPRTRTASPLELVVAVREAHADGSTHFHVAVKLNTAMRFKPFKATMLQRHHLPSHWSRTHSQLWSAIRYTTVATAKKPDVDPSPSVWSKGQKPVDLFELGREPYVAEAWRKRAEAKARVQQDKAPCFNKLDFASLVLSKHLHSKSAVLSYVQKQSSVASQLFVSRNQRRIAEFSDDAQEWAEAPAVADSEQLTDWQLVLKAAEAPCPHPPGACTCAAASAEIFRKNAGSFSKDALATALRRVLQQGPSKTCRVPFLVGPSNTGKSTLLYPFDDLFGPKKIFRKPAPGSTFALRSIVKGKRFIFWDDYRPVEYAHKDTVPVATFLSLFIGKNTEIQVSQSLNDGNLDVKWARGAVFTAKDAGLWDPTDKVSAEDVRHVRNRVEELRFTELVSDLKDVESCAHCMARWICSTAAAPLSAGHGVWV